MSRVIHFEVQAEDPLRAMNFYRNVFGWTFDKWDGPLDYWLIKTGEGLGINGGLFKREIDLKQKGNINAFVCTIDVNDLDESLQKITANHGLVEKPKHAIPGIGWLAYVTDSEGNLFSIIKPDVNAK